MLPARSLAAAVRLIDATRTHELPSGLASEEREDARLFVDMDLAILGAPAARFEEYERQIRAEYARVPDEAFRAGRSRVLRGFLERQPLFLSEWGRDRFAEPASSNLRRALAALEHASLASGSKGSGEKAYRWVRDDQLTPASDPERPLAP